MRWIFEVPTHIDSSHDPGQGREKDAKNAEPIVMFGITGSAVILPNGHIPAVKSQFFVGVGETPNAKIHGAAEENHQQEKLETDDPLDSGQID